MRIFNVIGMIGFDNRFGRKTVFSDGFEFNDCNVCLNPEEIRREGKMGHIKISVASFKGRFGFGFDFWGNAYQGGAGRGVWKESCKFASKNEALFNAVKFLKEMFSERKGLEVLIPLLNDIVLEERQLTLFD